MARSIAWTYTALVWSQRSEPGTRVAFSQDMPRHGVTPVRTERPDLLPRYRRLYPTGYAARPYVERLHATITSPRADFGLPSSPPPLLPAREPAQLALAW
jgi:hypothetical protein